MVFLYQFSQFAGKVVLTAAKMLSQELSLVISISTTKKTRRSSSPDIIAHLLRLLPHKPLGRPLMRLVPPRPSSPPLVSSNPPRNCGPCALAVDVAELPHATQISSSPREALGRHRAPHPPPLRKGRGAVAHHIRRLPAQLGPIRPIPPHRLPAQPSPAHCPAPSCRWLPHSPQRALRRGPNNRHRFGLCTSPSAKSKFGCWCPIAHSYPSDWCGQRRLLPYPLLQSACRAHPRPPRCSHIVLRARGHEENSGGGISHETGEAEEVGGASSS